MEYLVERDLFMSKLQQYLNDKTAEGYELVDMFVTEQDIKMGRDGEYQRASKITVIMKR